MSRSLWYGRGVLDGWRAADSLSPLWEQTALSQATHEAMTVYIAAALATQARVLRARADCRWRRAVAELSLVERVRMAAQLPPQVTFEVAS